jgi:hypothetical protein
MRRNIFFIMLACLISCSTAQAAFDKAGTDILKTYAFDPARMPVEEQAKHAQELADLWSRFHAEPETYLPAMRSLLGKKGNTELLYCDGGMLLLDESTLPEDRELGLEAIGKCALAEMEQPGYFYTLHKAAVDGADTLELQFKILGKPNFEVYDSTHNLTLEQDLAFTYPLLVQDESSYFRRIVERQKTEKDATAQQTLLAAIYYAATADSEKVLNDIASNKATPSPVRLRAQVFLKRIADMRKIEPDKVYEWMKQNRLDLSTTASESMLRDARRKRMSDISHDALRELDIYTLLIYQAMK